MDSAYTTPAPPRLDDDPVVAQLRTELRARGYVGVVMHRDDLVLLVMWGLGVMLGLVLAGRS
jgi:hypothetical protein